MSERKKEILGHLQEWLKALKEHRAESKARLERGRRGCLGSDFDFELRCADCYTYAADLDPGLGEIKLGDPCPGEEDICGGVFVHRYDREEWGGQHDWDGGECWRCNALDPGLHEGNGPYAKVEPCLEVPEPVVRELVGFLNDSRYNHECNSCPTDRDAG